tara:strand:- start:2221 stop:2574 length:354 start_codon:yes stop_codon:yes gene_type:complete
MADWRFVSDVEDDVLRDAPPLPPAESLHLDDLGVYEVVGGTVCKYESGWALDLARLVTPGWFAKVLADELLDHTYAVEELTVVTRTGTQELRPGALVALFPPEQLEIARERTNRPPE